MNFLTFLQKVLRCLARRILLKYRPHIIAVVGSVGKTSTKEAIYHILAGTFNVRRNPENYNNEIGLPLAVIGQAKQARSFGGWIKICLKGLFLIFHQERDYPKLLILEMAADKPGDLGYLLNIIPDDLLQGVVLTGITPVHMEFYGSFEKLFQEKTSPLDRLKKNNFLVVNKDDCHWPAVKKKIKTPYLSYSLSPAGEIRGDNLSFDKGGIKFDLIYQTERLSLELPQGVAPFQLYPLLAGVGVALFLGLSLQDIAKRIKAYRILPGRMNLLPGIKGTTIIDDSYNSSPTAAEKAIKALTNFPCQGKRIAVLGDMLELGVHSQPSHIAIGRYLTGQKPDYLIAIGTEAKAIYKGSQDMGFPEERAFYFEKSEAALTRLQEMIEPGDLILVKGSRGVHLEKLVKAIMAQPEKADEVLIKVS